MAYDHAAMKVKTRGIVHNVFAINVFYTHPRLAAPVPLRVRYHTKQDILGDLQNEGYGMVVDSIDRIIFHRAEIVMLGVEVEKGGRVTINERHWPPSTLIIETMEKSEGPVEEIWRVVKA